MIDADSTTPTMHTMYTVPIMASAEKRREQAGNEVTKFIVLNGKKGECTRLFHTLDAGLWNSNYSNSNYSKTFRVRQLNCSRDSFDFRLV